MFLVRRLVIRVSGRKHHAFDSELHHLVKMFAHAVRIGAVEERRVRGNAEAAPQRFFHAFNGLIVSTFAADREIVVLTLAVHVDGKRQVLARLEQIELFLEQQRVGAEIDIFLARHQAFHDLADLRVHQRLAAGNAHHGCAALIHGSEALLRREFFLQDVRRILDLAAARARQVTAKQRLQHQHQRIALASGQLLFNNIARHCPHL